MVIDRLLSENKITIEEYKERKLDYFRTYRKELFKSFDIWEKAVLRGREQDDPTVLNWYQTMLGFTQVIESNPETPLPTIPDTIKKYL
jgi:hypothetical protein